MSEEVKNEATKTLLALSEKYEIHIDEVLRLFLDALSENEGVKL